MPSGGATGAGGGGGGERKSGFPVPLELSPLQQEGHQVSCREALWALCVLLLALPCLLAEGTFWKPGPQRAASASAEVFKTLSSGIPGSPKAWRCHWPRTGPLRVHVCGQEEAGADCIPQTGSQAGEGRPGRRPRAGVGQAEFRASMSNPRRRPRGSDISRGSCRKSANSPEHHFFLFCPSLLTHLVHTCVGEGLCVCVFYHISPGCSVRDRKAF